MELVYNKKIILFASIAVGIILFTGGFFSYQIFAHQNGNNKSETLNIGAYGVVKAYHSDGTLFATWQGHNTLALIAANAIANCISGVSTTPSGYGSCTSLATQIHIMDNTNNADNFDSTIPATVSLTPAGCTGNAPSWCSGWTDVATFDSQITKPVTISVVNAMASPTNHGLGFDFLTINPTIPLQPGDRLVVTLTFSIPAE